MAGVQYDFERCRVLVTGGSNGIGAGIARAFSDAGAEVTITGTRADPSDYDGDLVTGSYRQLRITDAAEIRAVADSLDRLDILVNNAGGNLAVKNEYDPEIFEQAVAINLFGAYRMAAACKQMLAASELEGGASILNLASMSAFFAVPLVPGYGAAKAAVVQMTKNLAVAWARDRIRVNCVAPGLIETNMTAVMKGIEALEKPQIDRTPQGRWGTPEDVAEAVIFLSSDGASYITGQVLTIDGGMIA